MAPPAGRSDGGGGGDDESESSECKRARSATQRANFRARRPRARAATGGRRSIQSRFRLSSHAAPPAESPAMRAPRVLRVQQLTSYSAPTAIGRPIQYASSKKKSVNEHATRVHTRNARLCSQNRTFIFIVVY